MARMTIVLVALLCASCAEGEEMGADSSRIDVTRRDTLAPDAPDIDVARADGADAVLGDTSPSIDTPPPSDVPLIIPGCDPVPGTVARGSWSPSVPTAPMRATFSLDGPDPWANLVVDVRTASGATLPAVWIGVTAAYRWQWYVDPTRSGDYCVSVRTDPASTLRWRAPLRIIGSTPTDSGTPDSTASDVASPDVAIPPGTFVSRSGTEFMAGGSRIRFIGLNVRGQPHYGTAALPFATLAMIDQELDEARRLGARVVRVFAADENADHASVAARLQRVLDGAVARGMWVIVALTDFYDSTPFHPRGDRSFYSSIGGYTILNTAFFQTGYRTNFLPWVRTVVARYATHPGVFAWELGNEIKCDGDHRAFINFANDVGSTIRTLAPRHLITTGMITARWLNDAEARELHRLPVIDFATYHNYNGTLEFADFDYAVARDTGRPIIVEEAGFERGDRPAQTDADIRAHIDTRGGRGYMPWGFMPGRMDNGNGDVQFGFDRLWHGSDYDRLFSTLQSNATRIR